MKEIIDANPELKKHTKLINKIRVELLENDVDVITDYSNAFIVRVNQEIQ
jgi:hypothetical protein